MGTKNTKAGQGKVTGLAAEIGKRRPFELPEEEAHLNLLRTLSVLAEGGERLLKEHGLSEPTYNILRILRGSGEAGRPSGEIARDMIARVPDVTRLVDRLEEKGLASRCRIEEDRRVVQVRVTKAGLDLLAKMDAPIRETHKSQFTSLSRAELAELNRLLVKARQRPGGRGEESAE
jgi:DNA-binding MarR family transcriptional regulator